MKFQCDRPLYEDGHAPVHPRNQRKVRSWRPWCGFRGSVQGPMTLRRRFGPVWTGLGRGRAGFGTQKTSFRPRPRMDTPPCPSSEKCRRAVSNMRPVCAPCFKGGAFNDLARSGGRKFSDTLVRIDARWVSVGPPGVLPSGFRPISDGFRTDFRGRAGITTPWPLSEDRQGAPCLSSGP